MDCHADHGANGINKGVFGFEAVPVGNDFGGFMNHPDDCHESCNLHCRSLWPAEGEGEGNQGVSGKMCYPVHGAGECMACSGQAANGEQAEREQHGCGAGGFVQVQVKGRGNVQGARGKLRSKANQKRVSLRNL